MAAEDGPPLSKKSRLDLMDNAPRELSVVQLTQSHAKELRALTESLKTADRSRFVFQSVPHYMRRRAASHNINRLPRAIREKIKAGACPPPKKKTPSRYHRRRPKNLKAAYQLRQQRVRWLETHIWHAKRFHMAEKWGFRLPDSPTDKSERAGHRAATRRCMIEDRSYYQCVEIRGDRQSLLPALQKLFPADPLLSDPDLLAGRRLRTACLYTPGSYPRAAVTSTDVMFNPEPGEAGLCQVWLWYHVSSHSQVLRLLAQHLTGVELEDSNSLPTKVVSPDGSVTVASLADCLLRFTLHGETTNEVLCKVLEPTSPGPDSDFLKGWYSELETTEQNFQVSDAPRSALWCQAARALVSGHVPTQKDLNEKRGQLLVPGAELPADSGDPCVPVLVVRYASVNRTELILPSNWGMAFWVPLVYAGARAGGLREARMIDLELRCLHVPDDFPDTTSCRQEERAIAASLAEKHHKYPPSKRPNFDKLAVNSPFLYDWDGLKASAEAVVVVLRDKESLGELSAAAGGQMNQLARCEKLLNDLAVCYLVPVTISMVGRGVPTERSAIYLPTPDDLGRQGEDNSQGGFMQSVCKSKPTRDEYHRAVGPAEMCTADRAVIGYVKAGRYSHTVGSALGSGFVTLGSLHELVSLASRRPGDQSRSGLLALVRPSDSRQYRYALLNIRAGG